MKKLAPLFVFLCACLAHGQVGIGTSNPTSELEISTNSSGIPPLELNPQTSPVGTASGQLSVIGDQLYLFDNTRGKWLSVGSSTFNFGGEGSINNRDLEYAGDIDDSGPTMPHDGTIVYATLNSSGGNPTKGITLKIYNSLGVEVSTQPLNLVGGRLILADFNVDFSAGDYFMVSVDVGGGNVDDVSMVLWTKWRK